MGDGTLHLKHKSASKLADGTFVQREFKSSDKGAMLVFDGVVNYAYVVETPGEMCGTSVNLFSNPDPEDQPRNNPSNWQHVIPCVDGTLTQRTENGVLRIPIRELHYCQEEKVLRGEKGVFQRVATIWHIEFKEGFVKPAVAQRMKNKKVWADHEQTYTYTRPVQRLDRPPVLDDAVTSPFMVQGRPTTVRGK